MVWKIGFTEEMDPVINSEEIVIVLLLKMKSKAGKFIAVSKILRSMKKFFKNLIG